MEPGACVHEWCCSPDRTLQATATGLDRWLTMPCAHLSVPEDLASPLDLVILRMGRLGTIRCPSEGKEGRGVWAGLGLAWG